MNIYRGTEKPFVDAPRAVVAIKEIRHERFHLGIVHRSDGDNSPLMLDLAWHLILRNNPVENDYFWIEPKYSERRARQLATFCRLVALRNPRGLPYAFSNPENAIDPSTGEFLLGPTKLGLTCASFVLAMFAAVGLPLAVLDSWPKDREGDAEWQAEIIEGLEKSRASVEHIAAISSDIGCVRYRPTEVAAASSIAPPAAKYDDVVSPEQALRRTVTNPGTA